MLYRGILKTFDAATWTAQVQLAGSWATFAETVPVSESIPSSQLVAGASVLLGTSGEVSSLVLIDVYGAVPTAAPALGTADYDSNWFAVVADTTYTKAHGLGQRPRLVELWHSADGGTDEWVRVTIVAVSGAGNVNTLSFKDVLGVDATNVYAQTGNNLGGGEVVLSLRRTSSTGYYRILAWR